MKRARRIPKAAAFIAALGVVLTINGANAFPDKFCAEKSLQPITGFGVQSHFNLMYNLFIPAYEKACPAALGNVSFYTGSEAQVFDRLAARGPNPTEDVYDNFWSTDVSLTADQRVIGQIGAGNIVDEGATSTQTPKYSDVGQFPMFIEGLTVAYNLPCYKQPLNLTALNLSLMYLGVIKTWDDARLVADNAGIDVACTGKAVKLTARADSTGATLIFKSLLAHRNPVWQIYAQPQLNTTWPQPLVCRGGGDRGEAGCVVANSGSVGYVSMSRAQHQRLQGARIQRVTADQNNPGAPSTDFVPPTSEGCQQAAEAILLPPGFDVYSDWSQISLVDSHAGYPLCYFNFYDALKDPNTGYNGGNVPRPQEIMTRDLLEIVISAAVQKQLPAFGVGSLPSNILALDQTGIDDMNDCPGSFGPADSLRHPNCSFTPPKIPSLP